MHVSLTYKNSLLISSQQTVGTLSESIGHQSCPFFVADLTCDQTGLQRMRVL